MLLSMRYAMQSVNKTQGHQVENLDEAPVELLVDPEDQESKNNNKKKHTKHE
jgi:hypothetical protein